MKLRDASLQVYEKNSFTHSLSCILPSFSQNASRLLLRKSVRVQFLSAESSVNCNLPVQSRFIWANYLHVEYLILRSLECSFCQIEILRFLSYKGFCSVFWYILFFIKTSVLYLGDNNFLFWHLYQIHTFNNNLNEEGMITSYMMCANSFMIEMLL